MGAGGTRPTLTHVSSTGDLYLGSKSNPDSLLAAGANLKAVAEINDTGEFKTMNPTSNPLLGFGIDTVGNNTLAPDNFDGNIVGG